MKNRNILITLVAIILIAVFFGCNFTTSNTKIITPEIRAIGLPSTSIVGGITLKVSGPDMDTIEINYQTIPSVINMAVPEGPDRKFELTVGLSPAHIALPTTVATSYKGTATADITSDSAIVTLNMGVGSTKIIVPDARNARLVQIDDMLGTNWLTLQSSNLPSWVVTYRPWDLDIDGLGRIIVVNNGFATGEAILWAVDSISSSVFTPLYTGDGGLVAVTVDRVNSLIYFASSMQLYRCDYTGANLISTYNMTGIGSIRGLAVDNTGIVYIAGTTGAGSPSVFKYNSSGSGSISASYTTNLISPRDIMIKDNFVYIADYDSTSNTNHKIIQLSTNMDIPVELPNSGTNPMFGPQRFIAVLNKEVSFIDDRDDNINDLDKLVSLNDIYGTDWNTLGTFGSGINQFAFYYGC